MLLAMRGGGGARNRPADPPTDRPNALYLAKHRYSFLDRSESVCFLESHRRDDTEDPPSGVGSKVATRRGRAVEQNALYS